jgi:Ca2+-transporting ATPase
MTNEKVKRHYKGLTDAQVAESRSRYGSNIITQHVRVPLWRLFLGKFGDPLIVILMIIGVFAIGVSAYEYWGLHEGFRVFFEPIGIFVAIMLATGLAFYFELKAQKEFSVLNQENDHELIAVIRNGGVTQIPKCDVVVGDILVVQTGQEIPADARLLEAVNLIIDESSLTGEPPHEKYLSSRNETLDAEELTYPTSHIYRGTQVMEGHGIAEVFAIGDMTENGKIMQSLMGVEYDDDDIEKLNDTQQRAAKLQQRNQVTRRVKTPLNEQLSRLARWITYISYAVAVLVIVGRLLTYNAKGLIDGDISAHDMSHLLTYVLQTIMIAVTLVVVAVPEGLPMAVSLSLANSMRRMLKTNNLVRKMHACETMGAATVICTDKTGTLTQNQMRVVETTLPLHSQLINECIAVNSTASLDFSGDLPQVVGNPTEGALLLWLHDMGVDYEELRDNTTILKQTPFSPERKYMSTLIGGDSANCMYIKGAPEILLEQATHFTDGHSREEYESLLADYQQRALRTLAFMVSYPDKDSNEKTFLGIVGIEDPVRPDVKEAVEQCRNAGIDIKIVTGDTVDTAREIGRQIGLLNDDDSVIDGREFAALSHDDLLGCVRQLKIIARARPMDKKRLVEALQELDEVVAVTGDGTNDAPALNAAHVGLSMGAGTSVAKEASDITIIDNSFASIVRAVKWGRSLFQNIQRFLLFQLTVNVAACLLVLCGAFMGTQSPLTVTQMLWVNLIMDTFAAFALSALPPTDRVMHDKPRNRRAFILDRSMLYNIMGVGVFFFILLVGLLYIFQHTEINQLSDLCRLHTLSDTRGEVSPYELTLLFTIFVMTHFWYMFCARAYNTGGSGLNLRDCDGFITIALIIFLGQIAIVQLPVLNTFFNVVPLSIQDWVVITLLSSLVVIVREGKRVLVHSS